MHPARSPGAGPLTWVTLGLLVCSWLFVSSQIVDALSHPGGFRRLYHLLVLFCFATYLVCGLTAWYGRSYFVIRVGTFGISLMYLGFSAVSFLLYFQSTVAKELGLSMWMLDPWAYYAWALGLIAGIQILIWLLVTAHIRSTVEGE